MKKLFVLLLTVSVTAGCMAQPALKTTQVNIFKNGTYFVVKEGNLPVRNGEAMFELPKEPILSTFWLTTTKEHKITDIVYITDTIKKKKPAASQFDLLSANKGRKVKFTYKPSDQTLREVSGVLQDISRASGLVKVKQQDNKFIYFHAGQIVEMIFEESPAEMVESDSLARLAKIHIAGNPSSADLRLSYMQPGIQWMPSYNIKIINEKELQLEMKAIVENYAETIENAELTLTVGNPQFLYGTKTDPLAYNFLTNLYENSQPRTSAVQFAAQMYSNMYVSEEASMDEDAPYIDFSTYETEGEKTNDLYMYKLGKVSLPFRSKNNFMIFSSNIPYKDVYEVSLGDVANYAYYSYISNDPEKRFDVYHSLLITNNTKYPLTTGPVFVQNENLQPLAQDRIKYTPAGANASVQLSKAGDVVVKNKEEEASKVDNVKKVGKTSYNKVTIKGTIYLENLQDKPVQLNVKKDLTATVKSAGDSGKITKSGKYSKLNPYSVIEWEIPLGSKEKKSLSYEYEVYVDAGSGSSY